MKLEIIFFNFYCLNMNTSFTIQSSQTKFKLCAEHIHMQGSVSQHFDSGLHYLFYNIKRKQIVRKFFEKCS